jgi:hypothetical protein
MIDIKVTFANGDTISTSINATLQEAQKYYIGQYFNLGIKDDLMTKAVKVEQITFKASK